MKQSRYSYGVRVATTIAALMLILMLALVSCGGNGATTAEAPQEGVDEDTKLPVGMSSEDLEGLNLEDLELDTGESGEGQEGSTESDSTDPRYTAILSGARFSIVDVTRNESNQKVIESGQREVVGDYLEIELSVENVGDALVDFSQYSFRLESPSIKADEYRSYYGDIGYFGKYVSEHVISAVLLDYADLTPVLYKLKVGEVLEGVFLFYDLDPVTTARNEGFSADVAGGGAYLVIRKVRGDDYGEEVKISLTGFEI